MDQRNVDMIIIDEATEVSQKVWDRIGRFINVDIISDFRMYARDPARWVDRYQEQCRFHPEDQKEKTDGKQKGQ